MNCEEVQTKLAEETSARADEGVERHIAECAACRAFCQDLLELENLARSLGDQCRVPADFRTGVLSKISRGDSSGLGFTALKSGLLCLLLLAASMILFAPWTSTTEEREAFPVSDSDEGRFPLRAEDFAAGLLESPPYIEIVVQDSQNRELILRLPSEIEIRPTDLHQDVYAEQISY